MSIVNNKTCQAALIQWRKDKPFILEPIVETELAANSVSHDKTYI